MFKTHQDFETHFKTGIDPTKFPVDIMWKSILHGNSPEIKDEFFQWLKNKTPVSTKINEIMVKTKNGNYGFVLRNNKKKLTRKFYKNKNVSIYSIDNDDGFYYCFVEIINYFIFKFFLDPKLFVDFKSIHFVHTETEYQIAIEMDLLSTWYCHDKNKIITKYFNDIEALWKRGVTLVHRNLKLSNILMIPEGDPKIIDFGISMYYITFSGEGDETGENSFSLFNTGFKDNFTVVNTKHINLTMLSVSTSIKDKSTTSAEEIYNVTPEKEFSWRKFKDHYYEKAMVRMIL